MLQGSDDQTDKNIIPFINAAQNALALLHEPLFNPLSPNIHMQILQTDLYTFPQRMCGENVIEDQGIFSLLIMLLILIT